MSRRRRLAAWLLRLLGFSFAVWYLLRRRAEPRRPILSGLFHRLTLCWDRLPRWAGVLVLLGMRRELREHHLFATSRLAPSAPGETCPPEDLAARRSDGRFNDLDYPAMGAQGERFGRNFPPAETVPEPEPGLLTPSPFLVSRELMTRHRFIPVPTLNLLAAAWIQFETHDWFGHGDPRPDRPFRFPLEGKDAAKWGRNTMEIPRTAADPHPDPDGPPTYVNTVSHWWDASAIYGSEAETTAELRTDPATGRPLPDGHLYLVDDCLPVDPHTRHVRTGHVENWWLGLALLHTLFAREHNAICTHLRQAYPRWPDDRIFEKARLVVAALTAKIHTVEWTPAILAHPALRIAMRANWWGLATETVHRLLWRISPNEAISGIPGSRTDHHGVPFALTEEFVSMYRLHPLIPEELRVYSANTGEPLRGGQPYAFAELAFDGAQQVVADGLSMNDAFYSFGLAHPGAITLQNYPSFLQKLTVPAHDGKPARDLDLAATDIMRDRERGVPRYNRFRELLGKPRLRHFRELTPDSVLAEKIRAVYDGKIDRVDLQVGLFAENPPHGFGFSDTAFRIFILMASRRLKGDRFFTDDYTAEVYTPEGLRWVEDNTMASILLRHYPALAPALQGVENAFAPWRRLA